MDETFVLSILLKRDERVGRSFRCNMLYRGGNIKMKFVGGQFVSIGGRRSPVFVLEIQICRVISAKERKEINVEDGVERLAYQRYYYTVLRRVPD